MHDGRAVLVAVAQLLVLLLCISVTAWVVYRVNKKRAWAEDACHTGTVATAAVRVFFI